MSGGGVKRLYKSIVAARVVSAIIERHDLGAVRGLGFSGVKGRPLRGGVWPSLLTDRAS